MKQRHKPEGCTISHCGYLRDGHVMHPQCTLRPFGAFNILVGAGNCTRSPFSNRMGLCSSGTDSCITGLFWYLATCTERPWCVLLQSTSQTCSLGIAQSL